MQVPMENSFSGRTEKRKSFFRYKMQSILSIHRCIFLPTGEEFEEEKNCNGKYLYSICCWRFFSFVRSLVSDRCHKCASRLFVFFFSAKVKLSYWSILEKCINLERGFSSHLDFGSEEDDEWEKSDWNFVENWVRTKCSDIITIGRIFICFFGFYSVRQETEVLNVSCGDVETPEGWNC